jgi:hypothetical protein
MTNTPLDVNRARQLARNLAVVALPHARDLARTQVIRGRLGGGFDLDHALAQSIILAAELAFGLDRDLDFDHARRNAHKLARRLSPGVLDPDRDFAPIPALATALDLALDRARELEDLLTGVSATASSCGQLRVPMLLAEWLTAIAPRLLPGTEQGRYQEEFGSELIEIALAGGGRRAQLAYAARTVLSSAWQLRAATRSPRRRGAVQ